MPHATNSQIVLGHLISTGDRNGSTAVRQYGRSTELSFRAVVSLCRTAVGGWAAEPVQPSVRMVGDRFAVFRTVGAGKFVTEKPQMEANPARKKQNSYFYS